MTLTPRMPMPAATALGATPRLHPRLRVVLTVAAVGAAGLVLGGLTSPAQQYLPSAVQSLANSASGWTLLAVGLVRLSRLRPVPGAVAAALAMVLMVEGYGIVSTLRGYPNGPPLQGLFTVAALVGGPVVGAAAALLRHGSPRWRALAIVPLAAVLVGEGVYGLTVVADSTSPVYWAAMVAVGAGFTAWQLLRQRTGPRLAASVVGLVAVGATAFWIVYQQPLTLLF